MNVGLRVRLTGTVVGAILVFFIVSAVAANVSMSNDLDRLGRAQVDNGATGFGGYWDVKKDQVRLLVGQVAIQDAIRRSVAAKDGKALDASLANIARQAGLSFLTVVDTHGTVLGRANGGPAGVHLASTAVERALTGETVSTAAALAPAELDREELGPQVAADVKSADGAASRKLQTGLGLIGAAPISDENERTIGAIYGGVVMNHFYDVVDQTTRALGGKAAIVLDRALIASSIARSDGTRLVDTDTAAGMAAAAAGKAFTGIDVQAGVKYLAHVEPILDDQNAVVGARWYGVPLAQFTDIQNHTLASLVLWGVIGLVVALALAVPVVEALSRALIARSGQVRASAKELAVIVVGSEVSGDHVAQTRAAVEKQGDVLMQIATASQTGSGGVAVASGVSERVLAASALNAEILGDVVVIDTLAQEMSERMQQAAARVSELNDVAEGLSALVSGSKK